MPNAFFVLLLQCLAVPLALVATPALAQDVAEGRTLYTRYCASCHGSNPAIGSPATVANNPDGLLAAIRRQPQMNHLESILTAADRADITAYIGSVVGPPPTPVVPQTGWYWNAAQSGRGFFVEQRGGNVFMAGFHYANDGDATWFVGQGTAGSSVLLQSEMLMFANGQTLTGAYRAPVADVSPGVLTLRAPTTSTLDLAWPGGTVALTRFPFADGATVRAPQAGSPQSGWWWYDQEAGRGFAIEFQADKVFIAGFMYADDGSATWYVSNGTMLSPTAYEGVWLAFRDGQAMGGPYRAPTLLQPDAGMIVLEFTDATHGTLTLPDGRDIPLTRFEF